MARVEYYCRPTLFLAVAAALLLLRPAAGVEVIGMPGCETSCGNMSVPYPFGMGPSYCYHSTGFNLTCDRSSNPPRLLLGDGTLQVAPGDSTLQVVAQDIHPNNALLTVVYTGDIKTDGGGRGRLGGLGEGGPCALMSSVNHLILLGCNVRATLRSGNVTMSSCSSLCDKGDRSGMPSLSGLDGGGSKLCSGIGCCQAPIVGDGVTSYDVELQSLGWNRSDDQEWPARVFVAGMGWFATRSVWKQLSTRAAASIQVTVLLDWEVMDDHRTGQLQSSLSPASGSDCPRDAARRVCKSDHTDCTTRPRGGYRCFCKSGYNGNPYLTNGCQDINECEQPELQIYRCYGHCTNTIGSYRCQCPHGTRGDPYTPGGCYSFLTGSCSTTCGNVSVPYPFGQGPSNCYLPGFNLTCDMSHHPPRLMLGNLRVLDISIRNNTMRAISTDRVLVHAGLGRHSGVFRSTGGGDEAPYSLSTSNELILMGCSVQAGLSGPGNPSILSGCSSICSSHENGTGTYVDAIVAAASSDDDPYCYGMGCCQARISMSRDGMPSEFWIDRIESNIAWGEALPHAYAFIAEEGWFHKRRVSNQLLQRRSESAVSPKLEIPIVLEWEVLQLQPAGSPQRANVSARQYLKCPGICRSKNSFCKPRIRGYSCHCSEGFVGNPYLVNGCKGGHKYIKGMSIVIGVAAGCGIVVFALIAFFISTKLKHRRAQIMKRNFFKKNRGQLLQQLLSQNSDIAERMIISLEEIEKATNNFDKARELGGGGHGTVYKGILSDLHVVAIKKPKKVIQKEIDEFINEVAILSQINHINVVKLYGCCLETEVPMLVYEFISNGTLHDHLHANGPTSLAWDDRLRIAIETAKSIAYLHSTASTPIIHRDIKSVNILLDDTLTAKVADFGASRYVPEDKSGVTTMVQGTIGYMDPVYFYTGRLTDKSDVYGFGVMLVELLTRQKPFSYLSSEGDGLVAHFATLFTEHKLSQILDPQVIDEGGEEVEKVARVAVSCIKLTGEDRPSMRQVELTLEGLYASREHSLNNVSAKKFENNYIGEVSTSGEGSTRQYNMEEEFVLSSQYPR